MDTPTTNSEQDRVRWAREIPPAEKLIAGARLFDYACSVMTAGIRRQNPALSDQQILEIVRDRLQWASRWE
jgi:hypothetical protein